MAAESIPIDATGAAHHKTACRRIFDHQRHGMNAGHTWVLGTEPVAYLHHPAHNAARRRRASCLMTASTTIHFHRNGSSRPVHRTLIVTTFTAVRPRFTDKLHIHWLVQHIRADEVRQHFPGNSHGRMGGEQFNVTDIAAPDIPFVGDYPDERSCDTYPDRCVPTDLHFGGKLCQATDA
ncbi:MAG: hypothetical protein GPOALKHO_001447 [Sodalis sp.]|nr:MAG: hypothetical protein GPOALKHO_001447 [Sodalis sp.]